MCCKLWLAQAILFVNRNQCQLRLPCGVFQREIILRQKSVASVLRWQVLGLKISWIGAGDALLKQAEHPAAGPEFNDAFHLHWERRGQGETGYSGVFLSSYTTMLWNFLLQREIFSIPY